MNSSHSSQGGPAVDPPAPDGPTELPQWWEDPELATAVAEADQYAGEAGWDSPARLFALVTTDELRRAQPELAGHLADSGRYTPIAQDALPGDDLEQALAGIAWPEAVAGCVLVQEILVVPPEVGAELADDPQAAEQAARHPARTEARLAAGVLRGAPGGACLLRLRPDRADPAAADPAEQPEPLRGADLAPGLVAALHATFS
jgi:hypothetical protein